MISFAVSKCYGQYSMGYACAHSLFFCESGYIPFRHNIATRGATRESFDFHGFCFKVIYRNMCYFVGFKKEQYTVLNIFETHARDNFDKRVSLVGVLYT